MIYLVFTVLTLILVKVPWVLGVLTLGGNINFKLNGITV